MAQGDDISTARKPVEGKGVGMPAEVPGSNRPSSDRTDLVRRAIKRFDRAVEAEADWRKEAIEDLKFIWNDQWPADIAAQRAAQKRPCLTINKIPTFLNQIKNDQKQNRPAINISPVGDRADKNAAKMYAGLIKRIEYESGADIAIDTAFDSAVDMGVGYWRFITEYEDEDSFDQVIVWKRVRNAFTVYLDPTCQDPNGADAKWGFVTELVDRDDFTAEWPRANPCSWQQGGVGEPFKNWINQKQVRIAEYFEKEFSERKLLLLSTGAKVFEDELPDETNKLIKDGSIEILKKKTVEVPKVTWYKLTCVEVLDERDWAGKYIPIVRVVGEEGDIQGKVKRQGATRRLKDPQRMKNYWATKKTEAVAMVPNAPYIMAEGQAEGHEQQWKMANKLPHAVLYYKPIALNGQPVPPPQREAVAGPPAGIIEAEHGSEQDMMGVSGIRFDSTLQERTHDESGKALNELRRSSDLGSFHYVDNLSSALKFSGILLLDLIPKVMDTKRSQTILREDDTEQKIILDPDANQAYQEIRPEPGKPASANAPAGIFNPTIGRFGVKVTIGPSYATRRIEASHSMMEFIKIFPQAATRLGDLVAKYQDWPGAEEIQARLLPPEFAQQEIKNLPPIAQSLVVNLMGEMKKLMQERAGMLKQLHDQSADRAVDMEKIQRDFEAKAMKVMADLEKTAQANYTKLASDVVGLITSLSAPAASSAAVTGGGTTGQGSSPG
jgi:hypothetical protein